MLISTLEVGSLHHGVHLLDCLGRSNLLLLINSNFTCFMIKATRWFMMYQPVTGKWKRMVVSGCLENVKMDTVRLAKFSPLLF
jgi:hypothetical protein